MLETLAIIIIVPGMLGWCWFAINVIAAIIERRRRHE